MKPVVKNRWSDPAIGKNDVYVGRPGKWGNPFKIGRDGDRAEVMAKYRKWIVKQKKLLASIHELHGKNLVCWCWPKECHAEVLLELARKSAAETRKGTA
jgi:hypothetical protein